MQTLSQQTEHCYCNIGPTILLLLLSGLAFDMMSRCIIEARQQQLPGLTRLTVPFWLEYQSFPVSYRQYQAVTYPF